MNARSRGTRTMPLFTKNRKTEVQTFVLKVVNNNCPELKALIEGPRLDRRVNLTVVVMVVPIEDGELCPDEVFTAVTKEFSATGVALVLDGPRPLDEAILGFRWGHEMVFVRAKAKHLNPMGGGFYQLGFQITELAHVGDYPELPKLSF
jgi:hypothetical protein